MRKILKKFIIGILCMSVCIMNIASAATSMTFKDVDKGAWYYANLENLYSKNIINGFNDNTFRPASTLTRDQFIKLLVMTLDENYEYTKLAGYWFLPYMYKAESLGILKDKLADDYYKQSITREEVAMYVSRALEKCGYELQDEGITSKYKEAIVDSNKIKDIYFNAVVALYEEKIITGYTDGSFKPNSVLTRAEATAIIARLLDNTYVMNYKTNSVYNSEESNGEIIENDENGDYDETKDPLYVPEEEEADGKSDDIDYDDGTGEEEEDLEEEEVYDDYEDKFEEEDDEEDDESDYDDEIDGEYEIYDGEEETDEE